MMTDKPFLTVNEQVNLLRSRGLLVAGARGDELLRREGYYPVVNGYRGPFTTGAGQGERYVSGARLEHLGALLRFDRQLRGALMVGLSECEALLREVTVRAFSASHPGPYDYLDLSCYSDGTDRAWLKPKQRHRFLQGRDRLVRDILQNIGRPDSLHKALRKDFQPLQHYRQEHEIVPLWIAALPLTFGQVCTLYSSQMAGVRDEVCGELSSLYSASWGVGANVFHDQSVDSIYSFLRKLRNVCAHDERCYCVRLRARGERGVADIVGRMRYFMTRESYFEMEIEIDRLLACLGERVPEEVHLHVLGMVRPSPL